MNLYISIFEDSKDYSVTWATAIKQIIDYSI